MNSRRSWVDEKWRSSGRSHFSVSAFLSLAVEVFFFFDLGVSPADRAEGSMMVVLVAVSKTFVRGVGGSGDAKSIEKAAFADRADLVVVAPSSGVKQQRVQTSVAREREQM